MNPNIDIRDELAKLFEDYAQQAYAQEDRFAAYQWERAAEIARNFTPRNPQTDR